PRPEKTTFDRSLFFSRGRSFQPMFWIVTIGRFGVPSNPSLATTQRPLWQVSPEPHATAGQPAVQSSCSQMKVGSFIGCSILHLSVTPWFKTPTEQSSSLWQGRLQVPLTQERPTKFASKQSFVVVHD